MKFISDIPNDKKWHFATGVLIAGLAYLAFNFIMVAIIVLAIAAAKEIYDYVSKKGNAEMGDFVMTGLGGFLVIFLVETARITPKLNWLEGWI